MRNTSRLLRLLVMVSTMGVMMTTLVVVIVRAQSPVTMPTSPIQPPMRGAPGSEQGLLPQQLVSSADSEPDLEEWRIPDGPIPPVQSTDLSPVTLILAQLTRLVETIQNSVNQPPLMPGLSPEARPFLQTTSGSFAYADFSDTDGLALVGSTAVLGNVLRLTSDDPCCQTGAVWHNTKQPVQAGFETTFTFELSGSSNGDGFAFIIQNNPDGAAALGSGGCFLGYGDMLNTLAIEFDTFQNTYYCYEIADPDANHISIQSGGTDAVLPHHSFPYSLATAQSPLDLRAGPHTARVVYQPGLLQVFLDDEPMPVVATAVDLSSLLDLDNGTAWVGLVAATGGLTQNHDILNWSFSSFNYPVCGPDLDPNGWQTAVPLPQPLSTPFNWAGEELIVADGRLYVFGGRDADPITHIYANDLNPDGSPGNWITMTAALPGAYYDHSTVQIGDFVYFFTGADGAADVWYAPLADLDQPTPWLSTTSYGDSRQNFALAAANEYLYISGGNSGGTVASVQVTAVNPDGSLTPWTITTPLPQPVEQHAMVAYEDTLYVLAPAPLNTIYYAAINPADGTVGSWQTVPIGLPRPMVGMTAFVHNAHLYLIGGPDAAETDMYYSQIQPDGSLSAWTLTTALPVGGDREGMWAGGNGCTLYALGGHEPFASEFDDYYDAVYFATLQSQVLSPNILLIDDDNTSNNFLSNYTDALDTFGAHYDVWDVAVLGEPSAAGLATYDTVIWFTGEATTDVGPGPIAENDLAGWLADGGKSFLISSNNYHADRGLTGFMVNHLGVISATSELNYVTVNATGPLGDFSSYGLLIPLAYFNTAITGTASTETFFYTEDVGYRDVAVGYDGGTYRTTYWGFPFEALASADDAEMMRATLNWLAGERRYTGPVDTGASYLSLSREMAIARIETIALSAALVDVEGYPVIGRPMDIYGQGYETGQRYLGTAVTDDNGQLHFGFTWPTIEDVEIFLRDPGYQQDLYFYETVTVFSGPPSPILSQFTQAPNPVPINVNGMDNYAYITSTLVSQSGYPFADSDYVELWLDAAEYAGAWYPSSDGMIEVQFHRSYPTTISASLFSSPEYQAYGYYPFEVWWAGWITFEPGSAEYYNSYVSATPTELLANGVDVAVISGYLGDAYNNPIANREIQLWVSGNEGDEYITTVTTNEFGEISFDLTSTEVEWLYPYLYDPRYDTYIEVDTNGDGINFVTGPIDLDHPDTVVTINPNPAFVGWSEVEIEAQLYTTSGHPAADRPIDLYLDEMPVDGSYTDEDGFVSFYLYPDTVGEGDLSLYDVDYDFSAPLGSLTVLAGAADLSNSTITAVPDLIAPDGIATSLLTASLQDSYGNPVANREIMWIVSGNQSGWNYLDYATTDSSGVVTYTLGWETPEILEVVIYDYLPGTDYDEYLYTGTFVNATGAGAIDPITSTITLTPTEVLASGSHTAVISATLRDVLGTPVATRTISLLVNGFTYNTAVSDANGAVNFTLSSSTIQTMNVALYDGLYDTTLPLGELSFIAGPTDPESSTLTASDTELIADTLESAALIVTLWDSYFHRLPDHHVTIQATGEGITLTQPVTLTNHLGQVQATIRAAQPQVITVTAYDESQNVLLADLVEITFLPAPPILENSSMDVSPATAVADGLQTVIVSAQLLDAINRPIANRAVTLQVSGSNNTILPQATGNTDSDGRVTFTLTSTRAQLKTLTLYDVLTNTSLQLGSVTFLPGPVNAISSDVSIVGSSLARADGEDAITIQVTAYDAYSNPIPGATVALTTTGPVAFTQPGVTMSDGRATGTIRSSQVGTFVVRARVNGALLTESVTATFITAELTTGKTRSTQAYAGFPLTYTLTVANTGLLTATNVIFTDTLPADFAFTSQNSTLPFTQTGQALIWQAGDIGPGQSIVVRLVTTPDESLPDGIIVTNELVATTDAVELNVANNTATAQHNVKQPAPQLSIGPGHIRVDIAPNGNASASLTVRNTGLIEMTGITIEAPGTIPGLSISPTVLPNLAPGQQTSVNVSIAPTTTVPAGSYHDVIIVTEDSGGEQWALLSANYLPTTRAVEFTITNDQGQPVPAARVNLLMPNGLVNVVQGVTSWVNVTVGGVANANGVLTLPSVPLGTYQYTASATNHDTQNGTVSVVAGSGTQQESLTLVARPLLSVAPLSPVISVAPGGANATEIVITNRGAAPLTDITVTPPLVYPWIYLSLPSVLTPTLAPGESMPVSVYASPPATIAANIYNGYVMVSGSGQQQPVALTVNITEQNTRNVDVFVGKQLNGDSLANVQVLLTRQEASLLVTQGITTTYNEQYTQRTNTSGLATFTDLPIGRYNYVVNHQGYKRDEGVLDVVPADSSQGNLFFLNKVRAFKPLILQTSPNQIWNVFLYANPFNITWEVEPTDDGYEIELAVTRDNGAEEMEMFIPPREWEFTSCGGGSLQDQIGIFNVSNNLITLEEIVIDVPGVSANVTSAPANLPGNSTGIIQVSATKVGELSQGTIAITGTYQAVHTNTVSYTFNPSSFNSQNLLSGQTFVKAYELAPVNFDPNVAYTFVLTQPATYDWMVLQTSATTPVNLNLSTRLPFELSVTPPSWLGEGVYEDRATITFTDPDNDLTREGYLNIRVTKTAQGVLELHTNYELGPTPITDVPVTGKGDLIPRCGDDDGGGGGGGSGSGSGFGWIWGWLDGILLGNWSGGGSSGGGGGGDNGYWPPFSGTIGEMITIEGEANQEVRMEISQQLLLEGEGFQATLILNNRLSAETVNNINVDLMIVDENGNPANGLFEITPAPPSALGDLPAGGEVAGQWLILPVNMDVTEVNGRLFRIRAHMSYSVLGTTYTLDTIPRDFRVYPAPELIIDYELPYSEPGTNCTDFEMRATVHNVGAGPARNVRFNVQSLLIYDEQEGAPREFRLLEVLLDDAPLGVNELGVNVSLGVVPPGESRNIVWRFQPGSPGRFLEFTSDFRSLNLTGQSLTPRIREINTYINTNFASGCTITPGPHSPDLVVEILELPDTIVVSETVDIEVRVTNLGTPIENKNVVVRFAFYHLQLTEVVDPVTGNRYAEAIWIEVPLEDNEIVFENLSLGQNESETGSFPFIPPIFANYQLRVTVDPEN